jgi:asparagine synthase (glutamine-hydrolysing)
MCGICGFLRKSERLSEANLLQMNDVIRRRGPDGAGHLMAKQIGLAMRRLAIIDLSGGDQPIFNEDKTVAVVLNGEIYNYRELRDQLKSRGHRFSTESDTEVIVHLYEEYGDRLAERLEGMFAFALWDFKQETLLLARDRLGIKPLFIADVQDGFIFGSEIKSLLASNVVPLDIEWNALDQLLAFNYIPAPLSIYRAIRKVQPGTTLTVSSDGAIRERRYWSIPDTESERLSEADWVARIEAGFRAAIKSHLVSDVPVGAFLSGGIDSGLMVALMAEIMDQPVETFTVGFVDSGKSHTDERIYARQLAKRYHLKHNEISVEPHIDEIIHEVVDAFDEPFADDSVIPSYYVSQAAAARVKVAMTGLGGDELFGGYRRHLGIRVGDYYRQIPASIRDRLVDPLIRNLPEPNSSSDVVDHLKRFSRSASLDSSTRYQDSMTALPHLERKELFLPDIANTIGSQYTEERIASVFDGWRHGDSVARALKTDLDIYLPDDILTLTDRLSMWHSLELRVPFLHHPFVEDVMRIESGLKIRRMKQKYLLKQVAKKWLPESILTHKKQGFEAPMGRWLRGPLRGLLESTLSEENVRSMAIFDYGKIKHLIDEHVHGARKNNKILFSLLMFHLWHNRFIGRP